MLIFIIDLIHTSQTLVSSNAFGMFLKNKRVHKHVVTIGSIRSKWLPLKSQYPPYKETPMKYKQDYVFDVEPMK